MNRPLRALAGRTVDPQTRLVGASADDLTLGVVTSEKLLAVKEVFSDEGKLPLDMTFSKGCVENAIAVCRHRHVRRRPIEGCDALTTGGLVKWG